jgi:hypothetical protein
LAISNVYPFASVTFIKPKPRHRFRLLHCVDAHSSASGMSFG